jgi:hypothetical protein
MPASTVFWVVAPPIVIIVLTVVFFYRSRERSE